MNQRHLLTSLAALTAFSATALAQVPYGFLVTAESNTAPDGFRIIDPATGYITEISEPSGNFLGSAQSVAIDASIPNGIVASAGGSFGGAPVLTIPLDNNFYMFSSVVGQALQLFGSFERIHSLPTETLFTLSSVSDGLYTLPTITGTPVLLVGLSDATDIAVLNGKAYVNSFEPGQLSSIMEVDLTTLVVRTVGTGYPSIRSLGTDAGSLIAGREDGAIDFIDIASGVSATLTQTGLGSIIALVEGPGGNVYFATDSGTVYDRSDLTTPVYSSPHQLNDIDVGNVDQATQLMHGAGCAGAGSAPEAEMTLPPSLGSTYSITMTGAAPSSLGGAVLGFDRADVDLSIIGYPGCVLVADFQVIDGLVTNVGGGATVSVTIPSSSAFLGSQLNAQFFVLEAAGTLAMTPGIEGHMR